MKKAIKWIVGVLVLAAIAGGAWFFLKPQDKTAYITESVKRDTISQTVSATGEIMASQMVDVGAQASGQIKKLHVKLGQVVKKGDLIAEIDSTTQVNTLNTNKAKLETYQAQLASAEIALRSAEKKYKREQALWKENATSKAELETAEDTYAAAKAQITELKSSIKQTQIAINTAEADLGYTRITAPMDGTVVSVVVEEGQTVNANQTTPNIVQLADLSMMLNRMQIAEGDITKVQTGQKVKFTILSEPDSHIEAELGSIDPGLTTMSKGSYSNSTDTTESAIYYYARSFVPNDDGKLAIGMTTQNTIEIASAPNVLTVPTIAIKRRQGKAYVRVLSADNQATEKEITTGLKDSINTEVKSGLAEGEKVIISEMSAAEQQKSIDNSASRMGGGPRR